MIGTVALARAKRDGRLPLRRRLQRRRCLVLDDKGLPSAQHVHRRSERAEGEIARDLREVAADVVVVDVDRLAVADLPIHGAVHPQVLADEAHRFPLDLHRVGESAQRVAQLQEQLPPPLLPPARGDVPEDDDHLVRRRPGHRRGVHREPSVDLADVALEAPRDARARHLGVDRGRLPLEARKDLLGAPAHHVLQPCVLLVGAVDLEPAEVRGPAVLFEEDFKPGEALVDGVEERAVVRLAGA